MTFGVGHHLEHALDEVKRYVRVEQVAHRVHEDQAWCSPPVGELQQIFVQREAETGAAVLGVAVVLVPGVAHGLEALGKGERVAVVAAV